MINVKNFSWLDLLGCNASRKQKSHVVVADFKGMASATPAACICDQWREEEQQLHDLQGRSVETLHTSQGASTTATDFTLQHWCRSVTSSSRDCESFLRLAWKRQ